MNSPYSSPFDHLVDELRRVWLGVEYQIQRRVEQGILPQAGGPAARDAQQVRQELDDHCAQLDLRAAQATRAGQDLPLLRVFDAFALTPLQRGALTFALMPELDPDLITAYRYLSQDPGCRGLDARLLALLVYDEPQLRPQLARDLSTLSPLLRHRLLEVDDVLGAREPPLFRRIQVAPRLVQMLSGAEEALLDPLLRDVATLLPEQPPGLFPAEVLERAAAALGQPVLVVVQGPRGVGKRQLLQDAARRRGQRLLLINGDALAARQAAPGGLLSAAGDLRPLLRALAREAFLLRALPVLADFDDVLAQLARRDELPGFVELLCADFPGAVALTFTGETLPRMAHRPVVHLALRAPPLREREVLWGRFSPHLHEEGAADLAERYAVPGGVIRAASLAAAALVAAPGVDALDEALRGQLHDRLSRLGRRIDTPYEFDDLVVEPFVWDALWEVVSAVRARRRVREEWGLRGAAGVAVLFSGAPGVGKTMSATVLARELGLQIYEIDLSAITSKWIGETEKNLSEVFDAAEPGHIILLFNEADSLFGKRTTEVKSSTDRYANLETNYLLQRLERFGGLAILTSNLTGAIDPAFRRRFAYDIQFSFPSLEMRAELWQRAIPAQAGARLSERDIQELAERFELSGGFIKVAVERSAFVAAAVGEPLHSGVIIPTVERMYQERGKLAAVGRLE